MPKAKAHPGQMGFDFEVPAPAVGVSALAGLERRINCAVGAILASAALDGRSRTVIAAEMSDLLGDTVSKEMLDAYASPARVEHRVPMSRFWALLVVTGRQDMLDPLLREIGMAGLLGREVETARIGQLQREIEIRNEELRRLKRTAPTIRTGRMGRLGGIDGKPGD